MLMTELEFMEDFSDNLIYYLQRKGWSQRELAEQSDLSQAAINRYIKCERMPTIKAIINICYALDCDIEDLILTDEKIE